jgi:tetratricopeptide (TPR) repeat protein
MGIVVILLFGLLALVAAAFVAWPAWRVEGGGTAARLALTAAVALFVLAIGGGLYLIQGAPQLAERSLTKIEDRDYAGLIAMLSQDMRKRPNDVTGWIMLGRGYSKLRDPNDAAKAYARSIAIAGANAPAGLYALYGEALTDASGGEVTTDAAAAFEKAIALDPHDVAARYYLGLLHAQRRAEGCAVAGRCARPHCDAERRQRREAEHRSDGVGAGCEAEGESERSAGLADADPGLCRAGPHRQGEDRAGGCARGAGERCRRDQGDRRGSEVAEARVAAEI